MSTVAFIGLGNMGAPMAENLTKAGHHVTAFDLVPFLRDAAKERGISVASSAVEAAKEAEVVVTMLPAGRHVIDVWSATLPAA
ncbi:MAG: NAD(P)-binding domain-containing protein, partial [Beijerinckiaceae bacterium]